MTSFSPVSQLALTLTARLLEVRNRVETGANNLLAAWNVKDCNATFRQSLENLARFLALRSMDCSDLQRDLSYLGLSSLGRSESRVTENMDAVLATLARIAGANDSPYPSEEAFWHGEQLLTARQAEIFGHDLDGPKTRIMTTLPGEAAGDFDLIDRLVVNGADCMRINCAHDDSNAWSAMIGHIRKVAAQRKRDIKVAMDLGGPKIRIRDVSERCSKRLHVGDRFELCDMLSGEKGIAEASVSHVALIDAMETGSTVYINDGKITAKVIKKRGRRVTLEMVNGREKGERLKQEKGINLPGAALDIPALTEDDKADLDFVAEHADIVSFSFVQKPQDVQALHAELVKRRKDRPLPAVILKIETPVAVRNLPLLIVEAGRHMPVAVMIARGDLAVEIGFEALSQTQEEILWLCEAAHVPVVWATQVLDSLVRDGTPSRAETTDAAMAQRAECVMLNKGPHLDKAVSFLDGILRRMDRQHNKKSPRLNPLNSWSA